MMLLAEQLKYCKSIAYLAVIYIKASVMRRWPYLTIIKSGVISDKSHWKLNFSHVLNQHD